MSNQKYLFVDLPHLAHRCAYAQQDLTYNDKPVGMMYGVFRSLYKYRQMFPLYHIVLAKDAGHLRRDQESRDAVSKGIIPETYKENRVKKPKDLVKWQMEQQWDDLDRGLRLTSCQLVIKEGFEADDVIASYVLGCSNSCVIITSDHDYYQLLEPGVVIQDDLRNKKITFKTLQENYGLDAAVQWVDVGALEGDTSDNIFGVPGVGEKTATKLIAEHKSVKNLLEYLHEQMKQGKTLPKKQQAILEYEERVHVAYSLKQMDVDIEGLPELSVRAGFSNEYKEFLEEFGFNSLIKSIDALT